MVRRASSHRMLPALHGMCASELISEDGMDWGVAKR
jgi:hypothetical protein